MTGVVELEANQTWDLRRRVLRNHLPSAPVDNAEDHLPATVHLGVVGDQGRVTAIATLFPQATRHRPGSRAARVRGMAVDPDHQGRGVGALLLAGVVERARQEGYQAIWANGRDGALGFYQRHGWQVVGEGFTSIGLPHHVVVLDL